MNSCTEECRAHLNRYKAAKDELDWVEVLAGHSDCHLMLMVHLVDPVVQERRMQHTVAEVEGQVLHEHAEQELSSQFCDVRDPFKGQV